MAQKKVAHSVSKKSSGAFYSDQSSEHADDLPAVPARPRTLRLAATGSYGTRAFARTHFPHTVHETQAWRGIDEARWVGARRDLIRSVNISQCPHSPFPVLFAE